MLHHRWLPWAIGMCTVLVTGCSLVGFAMLEAAPERRLAAAKERWSANGPSDYRMVAEADPQCLLDVEVRGDEVRTIYRRDRCPHPARTVGELFALLDRLKQVDFRCSGYDCACRQAIGVRAQYDATLGYPTSISFWSRREPTYWQPSFWRYVGANGRQPPCERSSEVVMVRVISLTPLS